LRQSWTAATSAGAKWAKRRAPIGKRFEPRGNLANFAMGDKASCPVRCAIWLGPMLAANDDKRCIYIGAIERRDILSDVVTESGYFFHGNIAVVLHSN
jgi:hypothetical protein